MAKIPRPADFPADGVWNEDSGRGVYMKDGKWTLWGGVPDMPTIGEEFSNTRIGKFIKDKPVRKVASNWAVGLAAMNTPAYWNQVAKNIPGGVKSLVEPGRVIRDTGRLIPGGEAIEDAVPTQESLATARFPFLRQAGLKDTPTQAAPPPDRPTAGGVAKGYGEVGKGLVEFIPKKVAGLVTNPAKELLEDPVGTGMVAIPAFKGFGKTLKSLAKTGVEMKAMAEQKLATADKIKEIAEHEAKEYGIDPAPRLKTSDALRKAAEETIGPLRNQPVGGSIRFNVGKASDAMASKVEPFLPEPPPETRTQLKVDSTSNAPVYLDEVSPFIEGKATDRTEGMGHESRFKILAKAKDVVSSINASLTPPYHAWRSYPTIYREFITKGNEAAYKIHTDKKATEAFIKEQAKTYSPEELTRVGLYDMAQQKGGLEHLTAMGVQDIVPAELTPKELGLYKSLRGKYDEFLGNLNPIREMNGQAPIDPVAQYAPFILDRVAMEEAGINLMRDPATAIENAAKLHWKHLSKKKFQFENIRDPKASTPLVIDPLRRYQVYADQATEFLHITPIIAKGRAITSRVEVPAKPGELNAKGEPINGKAWSLGEGYVDGTPGKAYPRLASELRDYVDFLAGKHYGTNNKAMLVYEKLANRLRTNIATATMSLNFRSAAIQPTAIIPAATEVGWGNVTTGLIKLLTDPEARNRARTMSKVLPGRSMDIEVYNPKTKSLYTTFGEAYKNIGNKGLSPLKFLDMFTAEWSWTAAYEQAMKILKDPKQSALWADDVVLRTQGSGLPMHVAPIQRSAGGKFLTIFQTFNINQWNYLLRDVLGVGDVRIRSKLDAPKATKYFRLAIGSTILNTIYEDLLGVRAPMPAPMREELRYEKEGKPTIKGIKAGARELGQLHPFGTSIRWQAGERSKLPAGPQLVADAMGLVSQKNPRVAGEIAGKLLGIPGTSQASKTISRLEQGFGLVPSLVGVRTDVPRDKKKKKLTAAEKKKLLEQYGIYK